jgi:hypothetical protein
MMNEFALHHPERKWFTTPIVVCRSLKIRLNITLNTTKHNPLTPKTYKDVAQ